MTATSIAPSAVTRPTAVGPRDEETFTSGGVSYETLAGVATRLAALAVEDTLNGPSDDRTLERITVVEHLLRFANVHGSTRPAAAVRQALASMQNALARPGTPVLSVVSELQISISHTQ